MQKFKRTEAHQWVGQFLLPQIHLFKQTLFKASKKLLFLITSSIRYRFMEVRYMGSQSSNKEKVMETIRAKRFWWDTTRNYTPSMRMSREKPWPWANSYQRQSIKQTFSKPNYCNPSNRKKSFTTKQLSCREKSLTGNFYTNYFHKNGTELLMRWLIEGKRPVWGRSVIQ